MTLCACVAAAEAKAVLPVLDDLVSLVVSGWNWDALERAASVYAMDPTSAPLLTVVGRCLLNLGLVEDALVYLRRGVEVSERFSQPVTWMVELYRTIANAYALNGNLASAVHAAQYASAGVVSALGVEDGGEDDFVERRWSMADIVAQFRLPPMRTDVLKKAVMESLTLLGDTSGRAAVASGEIAIMSTVVREPLLAACRLVSNECYSLMTWSQQVAPNPAAWYPCMRPLVPRNTYEPVCNDEVRPILSCITRTRLLEEPMIRLFMGNVGDFRPILRLIMDVGKVRPWRVCVRMNLFVCARAHARARVSACWCVYERWSATECHVLPCLVASRRSWCPTR